MATRYDPLATARVTAASLSLVLAAATMMATNATALAAGTAASAVSAAPGTPTASAVAPAPNTNAAPAPAAAPSTTAATAAAATASVNVAAPSNGDDAGKSDFLAAMQRVRQHDPDTADSPALQAYVLYDYLVAARLRRDVRATPSETLDTTVDEFLKAHGAQPVTRPLRREWLASLAERKRWDWFLPRSLDVTEPALACDRLAARLATDDTATLAEDTFTRWNMLQRPPEECGPVFAWLRSQGGITPDLSEARARAALMADNPRLAREFLAGVDPARAAPLSQWIQLLEAPKAALAMLSLNAATPVEPDALAAGFNRLAFSDFGAASTLLPTLLKRPDITPALRARMQRSAALGAAYSRSPTAVDAFVDLPAEAGDTQVQEWRVRAALWAGDFARVATWIEAMPQSLAGQPRWRYWYARAVGATKGASAAAPLYEQIAGMRDYYGYLAADHVDRNYDLNIHPSADDAQVQATLAVQPGMMRAHALFDCGMTDEAGVEWAVELAAAKPSVKVQAAHLATRWEWYAQTIATLAQAGEWDDVPLRYPRPYASLVAETSKETRVPVDWIYAIMRQESLFRRDAVSRADARGLMQMQPGTAIAVARRWHLPAPGRNSLFDPPEAIRLGGMYVRELLDKYEGRLDQSLAAYNAGPAALARWLPARALDADIWIENIPYTETRGYVQHILEHIVAFATMRNVPPPRLATLLPKVEPPGMGPEGPAAP